MFSSYRLQEWVEKVQSRLYHLEAPQRLRTVPMQVLAVGPARSGTESLRDALVYLGYDHVYHGYDVALNAGDDVAWRQLFRQKWLGAARTSRHGEKPTSNHTEEVAAVTAEDFDAVVGHCAAITDFGAACFARELITAYPDAKVILNTRSNVDDWHHSCSSTIMRLKRDWILWIRSFFCAELFWVQKSFLRGSWPTFFRGDFDTTGKWVLEEHRAMVRGSVKTENLLEWSVEDGWEPLCLFLGKPIPQCPFPRGNGIKAYAEKIDILYKGYTRRADRNMLITLLVFCVLAGSYMVYSEI